MDRLHQKQEHKSLNQPRSRDVSPATSRLGCVERRLPIVIELFERGEYSAVSLRSEEECGERGYGSEACDDS